MAKSAAVLEEEKRIEDFALAMVHTDEVIEQVNQYLAVAGQEAVDRVQQEFYQRMLESVSAEVDPRTLKAASWDISGKARAQARTLITRMTRTEILSVGGQLAEGLKKGLGPRQIALHLENVKGLDAGRQSRLNKYVDWLTKKGYTADKIEILRQKRLGKLLRDRRSTIARTESAYATGIARQTNAEKRGKKFKSSISVGDSRTSDICRSNEALGPIPIEQNWIGGNRSVPHHPNCRCSEVYGTERSFEAMTERAAVRAERTARHTEDAVPSVSSSTPRG